MSDQASLPSHVYLWDNRALYAGPALGPRYRSYGSATLVIGNEGKVRVHRQTHAEEPVETRCCVIKPGLPVYLETGGRSLIVLFLDPFQHDLKALAGGAQRETQGILWQLAREEQIVALANRILLNGGTPESITARLAALGLPDSNRLDPEGVDPRVVKAVSMIRTGRTQSISTEDIAVAVSLSVPRVIQLFRRYLGVSAGKYRQWHRLHATTLAVANGQSFTQASVAAGFSDLAHFSNTYHSMLGIMPSSLLRPAGGVQFHVDARLAREGFSTLAGIDSVTSPMC